MANKFSDRVIEPTDSGAKLGHGAGSCPELLKVTPFKDVGQVDNASHLRILELCKIFIIVVNLVGGKS